MPLDIPYDKWRQYDPEDMGRNKHFGVKRSRTHLLPYHSTKLKFIATHNAKFFRLRDIISVAQWGFCDPYVQEPKMTAQGLFVPYNF